ncbi:CoA transferase [Ascidiaceihabitans sp.]|uniref:CoA transferase n=1 Tax=Ascidiaceihabitans sp. TaxID=1872644 RepID=UPI00329A7BCF
MTDFASTIAAALGSSMPVDVTSTRHGVGHLPSVYAVTDLATASIEAAGREFAALRGAQSTDVDRRLASFWFDMTLRPQGWELPSIWDDLAGDYATSDGWIRLHTNAPQHRAAALRALGCEGTRDAVTNAVAKRQKNELESAIVAQNGCAAAMLTEGEWAAHPQGMAVLSEPLIAWETTGQTSPAPLNSMENVRILDLTRILAGPVATRFLAGFGAEVLRIDPLDWEEPAAEPEVTLGKRCAGLDLRDTADRKRFQTLLAQADVLVHGYRADALEGLGLGSGTRAAINPNCIDVCLNAYGWSGPWTNRRGFDSLVQMSAGIAASGMQAANASRPKPLPVQALDHATGYLMAAAVLRGLRVRAATGEVMTAKLSLARTARLLVDAGPRNDAEMLAPETLTDCAPHIEQTVWGPSQRITFPLSVSGTTPHWRYPAGPLKTQEPVWT